MKIIGIGNALVDLMTQIDNDATLENLNLPKGSMQLVDGENSKKAIGATATFKRTIASGGSAANTIHGLARLDSPVGFIGKIGRDEMGTFFKEDMQKSNIDTYLLESDTPSGVALALVSPDGERTFATYLGAAVEMTENDISPDIFEGYDILHIEGYLLQNYSLISQAIKTAKEKGLLVSVDLASYNVVEDNRDFLNEMIDQYTDIVFANEEESKALTGLEPEESVKHLQNRVDIAVVKTGPGGSLVSMNGQITKVPANKVNVVDTTGAGDLYASGFLYGLINNYAPYECGLAGTILGGEVIQHIGAKIPEELWDDLNNQVKNLKDRD
ncbi:MAG: adenosine kinase [Marinilabiliales bacterium]|nr:MAG: adenosine kinase [Marinilabiliales bacterium]